MKAPTDRNGRRYSQRIGLPRPIFAAHEQYLRTLSLGIDLVEAPKDFAWLYCHPEDADRVQRLLRIHIGELRVQGSHACTGCAIN